MHVTSEQCKDPIVMNTLVFRAAGGITGAATISICCCVWLSFSIFSFCTATEEILGRLLLRCFFKIHEFHLVWVSTFLT